MYNAYNGGTGWIGTLNLSGGTVNNAGAIENMTYANGTYNRIGNGSIGALNVAGDTRDIGWETWGTVDHLTFDGNGNGIVSIAGFVNDGAFGFSSIQVTESVNLANANLLLNLSGTVDDWFGLASWDNIFGSALVDGWETALFSASWEDGTVTDWLAYGQTWTLINGNFIAFNDAGMMNAAAASPEPATLAIVGLGLAGLGLARRRKAA